MKTAICILLSILLPFAAYGQEDIDISLTDDELLLEDASRFSISGHYKNLITYFRTDHFIDENGEPSGRKELIADLNRIRLSPEFRFSENILLHCDIDNEIIAANYVGSRTFDLFWRPSDYNDLYDPSLDSTFADDYSYQLNLHRLYMKFVSGDFTMTAGRQQIRFGSGRLWNPLDILNPISPTFVEGAEDQKGTDALRVEYYPDESSEIAFVYAPRRVDDELDFRTLANKNTHIISRIRATVRDTDLAVLGGRVARRNLVGIDIAAILMDGMLRGSLLYASPDEGSAYFLGSVGYEYNFANGIYCMAEYFYNENALNRNRSLLAAYEESALYGMNEDRYQQLANQFLTFNRHYAGIAIGYDITPLLRCDLFAMADIEGRGIYFSPSLKYNLLQNIDISVTAMLGHVFEGADHTSDFESFEDHPLFSVVLQWYF
ncbi:hypothetical protein QUF72_00260 [Desulfobacterales bacterium HSG2]|nr:hypothetical protein [Desulfobacterales bacterium HSG2]